jgi:hypothetical protein
MSIGFLGKKHNKKTLNKMSISQIKRFKENPHSKITKIKIGLKSKGRNKGIPRSEKIRKKIGKSNKGKKHTEITKIKMRKNHSDVKGSKNPNWKGGISRYKYPINWNESLRRIIRERDRYTCQLCGKPQGDNSHDVHHIDYNKLNCNPNNLITLCHLCNSKVNANRNYWTKHFQNYIQDFRMN